ncbi:MAG: AAA family ATPase, partial [Synergistaceae bacterium]|nr:AAA family ATPase [Synergistaceae bacterium]
MGSELRTLRISPFPDAIPETDAAICRSRLLFAVEDMLKDSGFKGEISVLISSAALPADAKPSADGKPASDGKGDDELSLDKRAERYSSLPPLYSFDRLVLPDASREDIFTALDALRLQPLVFDEWGLREIEPFPRAALNFYGPPGTGKTMAAHALAHALSRPILAASYAEIESKFHGDGPKNVQAIFRAAERDGAVLFIDEADSLLSRRLTNVTQGSEQAINSMRSQLLICLERFGGVVIFSTNLIENYDKAFETRVRHVEFKLPDKQCLTEIWRRHLVPKLPVAEDVEVERLAEESVVAGFCGRDVKNAVIEAAVRTAQQGGESLTLDGL